ncbi:MAG TPA: tetratricopeptide repeat protein [Elusimicrobiales bacterium]|nr:tetratricopeptide repeat protein [Elusimicrobiales bacterium]
MSFYDAGMLREWLRAVSSVRKARLPAAAARLRELHLFMLRARLEPRGRAAAPAVFSGRLSAMNPAAARLLLASGRPAEAARALAPALKNFPGDENACGLAAEALLCSGKSGRAFAFLARKSRALRSPSFEAWRGQLLLFAGRYEEALRALRPGAGGRSPMSHCWRGAALAKLGRRKAAAAELRKALAVNGADLEARTWLAETLLLQGRLREAAEEADRVLNSPWALLISGLASPARQEFFFSRAALLLPGRKKAGDRAWALGLLERARGCRRCEGHFLALASGGER